MQYNGFIAYIIVPIYFKTYYLFFPLNILIEINLLI